LGTIANLEQVTVRADVPQQPAAYPGCGRL
jgi:hypothetical protein